MKKKNVFCKVSQCCIMLFMFPSILIARLSSFVFIQCKQILHNVPFDY